MAATLAVGMVPAIALADEAVEPVQDDALELLATQTGPAAFTAGTVTLSNGKEYTNGKTVKIAGDGKSHQLKVTKVVPNGTTEAADPDEEYEVNYYTDQSCTTSANTDAAFKTKYYIKITGNDSTVTGAKYNTGAIVITVDVTASKLAGASLYEYAGATATDEDDVSDTDFVFTGANAKIGLAINGVAIDPNAIGDNTKAYTVVYHAKDTGATVAAPKYAGQYVAEVTKNDTKESVEIPFEIKAIDLSSATITISDQETTDAWTDLNEDLKVNGKTIGTGSELTITRTSGPAGDSIYNTNGAYTASVTLASSAGAGDAADVAGWKQSIIGTGSVTFNKVGEVLDDNVVKYSGASFADATVDLSNNETYDLSKITVTVDGEALVAGEGYTVTVMDESGKEYTGSAAQTALAEPGKYTVSVMILPGEDYEVGGGADVAVTVSRAETTTVAMSFNGVAGDDFTSTFDGTDQLDKLTVVVRNAKGVALVEGTDYDIKVATDDGIVAEAINADTYTITVVGKNGYQIDGTADLEIEKVAANLLELAGTNLYVSTDATDTDDAKYTSYLNYTGSAIKPAVKYAGGADGTNVSVAKGKLTAKTKWDTLDEDAYKLTIKYRATAGDTYKEVEEIKEAGQYEITIAAAATDVAENYTLNALGWKKADDKTNAELKTPANYIVDGAKLTIEVRDERKFQDVVAADWFYDVVNQAAENGYMTGIGGTNFFAPNENLTRAQAAQVIFNMAGGDEALNEGQVIEGQSYALPFADTNGAAWYAKAVYWANGAGIVTGYDKGGKKVFEPEASVTRQQFALMLQRYAKLKGDAATGTADLSAYADGNAVASWATNGVKWAVGAGIMGKDTTVLNPNGDIARKEAAAMTVRYQPKAL